MKKLHSKWLSRMLDAYETGCMNDIHVSNFYGRDCFVISYRKIDIFAEFGEDTAFFGYMNINGETLYENLSDFSDDENARIDNMICEIYENLKQK